MKGKILSWFFLFAFFVSHSYAGWTERKEPVMKEVGWNNMVVHGDKLVFGKGGGRASGGLYLYEMKGEKVKSLNNLAQYGVSDIYGDYAVFNERGEDVYLVNIKKKSATVIGKGRSAPAIYSNLVVYEDSGELVLYDLVKRESKRVELPGEMLYSQETGPAVYGNSVVWIEKKDGGGVLVSYDIKKGKMKRYGELAKEDIQNIITFKFQKGIVLISNQQDVFIYNLDSGVFKKLTRPESRAYFSNISDGKVVWDSHGGEVIGLYDIAKDEYTELVSEGASTYGVAVSGNKVFFVDYKKYELRMFEFKPEKK